MMTALRPLTKIKGLMSQTVPDHERLFDEICNKLNELSYKSGAPVDDEKVGESSQANAQVLGQKYKLERMHTQMKKFQDDMYGAQAELKEKIRSLDSIHHLQSDFNLQVKQVTEQLAAERNSNLKLNADLSKSLELNLQLQLEFQAFKARTMQTQAEDKRYQQSLVEKQRQLQKEVDGLYEAKSELEKTVAVQKASMVRDQQDWQELRRGFELKIKDLEVELDHTIDERDQTVRELLTLREKSREQDLRCDQQDQHIEELNMKLEDISHSFTQVESSALQQNDVLKNLMTVAENKIVEMKLGLDKKVAESQDYYSHLQQALNQMALIRQENTNLKEYIGRLTYFIQQSQQNANHQAAQAAAAQAQQGAPASSLAVSTALPSLSHLPRSQVLQANEAPVEQKT